jgi:hypothetical protein
MPALPFSTFFLIRSNCLWFAVSIEKTIQGPESVCSKKRNYHVSSDGVVWCDLSKRASLAQGIDHVT